MSIFSKSFCAGSLCAALAAASFGTAAKADETSTVRNGRIGYVQSAIHWAVYQTADGKAECPQGLNPNGPREIFKKLWPNGGKMEDTILVREVLNAFLDRKSTRLHS